MQFQLEVQQIDRTCLFKLAWGKGQQISATLPYPIRHKLRQSIFCQGIVN